MTDEIKNIKIRNQKFSFKIVWLLLALVAVAGIVEIMWLAKFGNTPQQYTDVVLEALASIFGNKTIELQLYWIIIFGGLGVLYIILSKWRGLIDCNVVKLSDSNLALICIVAFTVATYFFWGQIYKNVLLMLVVAVFAKYTTNSHRYLDGLILYIITFYSTIAVYTLYSWFGGGNSFNDRLAGIIAFFFSLVILMLIKDILRVILVLQIFLPGLLLLNLVSHYNYHDSTIIIKPNRTVYCFIVILIIVSFGCILRKVRRLWNNNDIKCEAISIFSIVSIMAINTFNGAGYIMISDMHHPAENTIAFNEIINLGQKFYDEYVPVSGLFSFIEGAFLWLFGDGKYTSYSIANNMFYLFVIMLTVVAVRMHLNSYLTLLICTFLYLPDYSRVVLILPFFLFLTSKKISENPFVWVSLWVLLGWFYGLYYPAYGVAIVISFIPMGGVLLRETLNKSHELGKKEKLIYGIIGLFLVTIVGISIPTLIKTARHVIDMSDGLMYVESVSAFGYSTKEDFLNFLSSNDKWYTVLMVLRYVVKFTIPGLIIWMAYIGVKIVGGERVPFDYRLKDGYKICAMIAGLLFPLTCFYFSLYRVGSSLFNKAIYIIVFCTVSMMILLYEYGKDVSAKYTIILAACVICALQNMSGFSSVDGKFFSEYTVPEGYEYVKENQDYPNLGEGFVQTDIMNQIRVAADKYKTLDKNREYYMLFVNDLQTEHGMAFDEILNIKGVGMLESLVVRGFSISEYQAKTLLNANAIVGNCISPVDHYYLYRWLMTGGYYKWNSEQKLFYPVKSESYDEVINSNSEAIMRMPSEEVGEYAASLGNSIESLSGNVLTETNPAYKVSSCRDKIHIIFDNGVQGNDVDYIFIEADIADSVTPILYDSEHQANNKLEYLLMKHKYNNGLKCVIEWTTQGEIHTMSMEAENGRLLVPIGAGTGWLCNNHDDISIWFELDGQIIDTPNIDIIRYYRLRDLAI